MRKYNLGNHFKLVLHHLSTHDNLVYSIFEFLMSASNLNYEIMKKNDLGAYLLEFFLQFFHFFFVLFLVELQCQKILSVSFTHFSVRDFLKYM